MVLPLKQETNEETTTSSREHADALESAAKVALDSKDESEEFNTVLAYAERQSLTSSAMIPIVGLLHLRGAVSKEARDAWIKEGADALGERARASKLSDRMVNSDVREHASRAKTWKHAELVKELNEWSKKFISEFFGDGLPPPVISVARARHNNLGSYQPGHDALALRWRININLLFVYESRPGRLATLLHELLHLWEEESEDRKGGGRYHTKKFRTKAAELGIPCDDRGVAKFRSGFEPNGAFAKLLAREGVALDGEDDTQVVAPEPRSTLMKWICRCERRSVWTGAKANLRGICLDCESPFRRSIT